MARGQVTPKKIQKCLLKPYNIDDVNNDKTIALKTTTPKYIISYLENREYTLNIVQKQECNQLVKDKKKNIDQGYYKMIQSQKQQQKPKQQKPKQQKPKQQKPKQQIIYRKKAIKQQPIIDDLDLDLGLDQNEYSNIIEQQKKYTLQIIVNKEFHEEQEQKQEIVAEAQKNEETQQIQQTAEQSEQPEQKQETVVEVQKIEESEQKQEISIEVQKIEEQEQNQVIVVEVQKIEEQEQKQEIVVEVQKNEQQEQNQQIVVEVQKTQEQEQNQQIVAQPDQTQQNMRIYPGDTDHNSIVRKLWEKVMQGQGAQLKNFCSKQNYVLLQQHFSKMMHGAFYYRADIADSNDYQGNKKWRESIVFAKDNKWINEKGEEKVYKSYLQTFIGNENNEDINQLTSEYICSENRNLYEVTQCYLYNYYLFFDWDGIVIPSEINTYQEYRYYMDKLQQTVIEITQQFVQVQLNNISVMYSDDGENIREKDGKKQGSMHVIFEDLILTFQEQKEICVKVSDELGKKQLQKLDSCIYSNNRCMRFLNQSKMGSNFKLYHVRGNWPFWRAKQQDKKINTRILLQRKEFQEFFEIEYYNEQGVVYKTNISDVEKGKIFSQNNAEIISEISEDFYIQKRLCNKQQFKNLVDKVICQLSLQQYQIPIQNFLDKYINLMQSCYDGKLKDKRFHGETQNDGYRWCMFFSTYFIFQGSLFGYVLFYLQQNEQSTSEIIESQQQLNKDFQEEKFAMLEHFITRVEPTSSDLSLNIIVKSNDVFDYLIEQRKNKDQSNNKQKNKKEQKDTSDKDYYNNFLQFLDEDKSSIQIFRQEIYMNLNDNDNKLLQYALQFIQGRIQKEIKTNEETLQGRYIDYSQYQQKLVFCNVLMNRGKTYGFLQQYKNQPIIYISSRISLLDEFEMLYKSRFSQEQKFNIYRHRQNYSQEIDEYDDQNKLSLNIIQIDSIHKLNIDQIEPNSVIFIDEMSFVIDQIKNKKMGDNITYGSLMRVLHKMIQNTNVVKIIIADSLMDVYYAQLLNNVLRIEDNVFIHDNFQNKPFQDVKCIKYETHMFEDKIQQQKDHFYSNILYQLEQGKKNIVFMQTVKDIDILKKMIDQSKYNVLVYRGDEKYLLCKDNMIKSHYEEKITVQQIHKLVKEQKIDIILASQSISYGMSFNTQSLYFDNTFIWCESNSNIGSIQSQLQQICRIRIYGDNCGVHLYIQNYNEKYKNEQCANICKAENIIQNVQKLVQNIDQIQYADINIYHQQITGLYQLFPEIMIDQFLQKIGFNVQEGIIDDVNDDNKEKLIFNCQFKEQYYQYASQLIYEKIRNGGKLYYNNIESNQHLKAINSIVRLKMQGFQKQTFKVNKVVKFNMDQITSLSHITQANDIFNNIGTEKYIYNINEDSKEIDFCLYFIHKIKYFIQQQKPYQIWPKDIQKLFTEDQSYESKILLNVYMQKMKGNLQDFYDNDIKSSYCIIQQILGCIKKKFPFLSIKLDLKTIKCDIKNKYPQQYQDSIYLEKSNIHPDKIKFQDMEDFISEKYDIEDQVKDLRKKINIIGEQFKILKNNKETTTKQLESFENQAINCFKTDQQKQEKKQKGAERQRKKRELDKQNGKYEQNNKLATIKQSFRRYMEKQNTRQQYDQLNKQQKEDKFNEYIQIYELQQQLKTEIKKQQI